jgi:hypothetical protein
MPILPHLTIPYLERILAMQQPHTTKKTPELKQRPLMGVCVACGKSIMEGAKKAAPIDDFWTCSSDCLRGYQEASAGWSAEKILRVKQWQEQAIK